MTTEPRAFFAVDIGSATTSAALIGRVAGRWRLLSSLAFPAGIATDTVLAQLVGRLLLADPGLAGEIGLRSEVPTLNEEAAGESANAVIDAAATWPRLVARSAPTPTMAVLAASHRQLAQLSAAADRSGWRTVAGSLDRTDGLALTRLVLDRRVSGVLVGSGDPPGGDERKGIEELAAVVAAAAHRRPDLQVVLAGAMADFAHLFDRVGFDRAPEQSQPTATTTSVDASDAHGAIEPGHVHEPPDLAAHEPRDGLLLAPHALAGDVPGEPLRHLLDGLRGGREDSRLGIARATASLALILDRRLETLELGFDAGLRSAAWPIRDAGVDTPGEPVGSKTAVVADAALVPPELDDAVVDAVLNWSTVAVDRHRLRDRLRELRLNPWAEPYGEGALLRMAAARAALARLVSHTPEFASLPTPDVVIAAGGPWFCAPGPAVGLAIADAFRRPGAYQMAFDHARLLGPIGTIEDEDDRRRLLIDLADDVLTPLGSVVVPQGLRAGKSAGQLIIHGGVGSSELDMVPGGLELVDLPAGQMATAEMRFKDPVLLGTVGRNFAVEFAGGLGGLLVDLRDVPLRFPERIERRRQLLDAWQRAMWPGMDG